MVAGVTLRTVWLNDAVDLTDLVSIPFVTRIDPTPSTPGEVREYGADRLRAVLSGTRRQTFALSFAAADRTLVDWLRAKDGVDLWYRDDWEKWHGIYFSPQITRHPYDAVADVSLTFVQTTATEAV